MYISGETINQLCPISIYNRKYLDEFSNIKKYVKKVIYVNEKNPDLTKILENEKNIFFTKIDWIDYFINSILPVIKKPFILVTHNGDFSNDNFPSYTKIINHPHLVKWFGENMNTIKNIKTEGIPLGLENQMWRRTNFDIIEQNKTIPKTNLLYLNFSLKTNKTRKIIMEYLLKKGFTQNKSSPWNEYMKELASYKFAISPEGNGIDCHRTWECLYLGVIPIVKNSNPMSYFKELPILFVDDYSCINNDFLNKTYEAYKKTSFNLEKLNIDYYRKKVDELL